MWAGELPLVTRWGSPADAPDLAAPPAVSASVAALVGTDASPLS